MRNEGKGKTDIDNSQGLEGIHKRCIEEIHSKD